ncbi:hypothetical protein SRHO_G00249610 [Serrasalmus rhombeus]
MDVREDMNKISIRAAEKIPLPDNSCNVYEEMKGGRVECQIRRNNKKQQSSAHEKLMSRCLRLTAVCLGLLCVLLMTAVTLLCAKLTEERSQLQNTNTKLSYLEKAIQEGWRAFNSSLYFISNEKRSWTESREDCTERGADLVIINSREEQEFVDSFCSCKDASVFIGLTDAESEGIWKWVDGSALTTAYWMSGQPNNGGWKGQQDCAVTRSEAGKRWNDKPCQDLLYWICEKKRFS